MEPLDADSLEHALLTTRQAARVFLVEPRTVRRWRRTGRLTAIRIGREWRFRRTDIESLLGIRGDRQ